MSGENPLADVAFTECGATAGLLVTPDGDALLSTADISAAAGYTECAESMREGTVRELDAAVSSTFCVLQRVGVVSLFGGQMMARITVADLDATGAIVLAMTRWPAPR